MSYKDKPQIKLYKYENSAFVLQAIIDDFQEVSFEHNIYQAGTFTISINYNIPNALLFERGLFVQFGNNPYDFGEIITIADSIGQDGKGSQIRTITGRDARYILKRRIIKNMNSNGLWAMTDKGELVLRNLIKDQCGSSAEAKRQLPIANTIPASADAKGKEYSASENFSNLYEVCKTIATQSEIGWRMSFDGSGLTLEVYEGTDRSQTVRFDTSYESLSNGEFQDSSDSFSNAIYIGGKGQNDDRDIYEGEDGTPSGLDRFESWDNQSSMTTESEYEAEAISMLTQYGQTLTMNGNGLAKCPYIFREQYDIGDTVTVAFSGKSAKAQILSITEHWTWGSYDISFAFGKPQNNLSDQLQLMLRKIQEASNKTNSTDSVRWYTIPTDTSMPKADVTYTTIGFIGDVGNNGKTFTLYRDASGTGSKTYHVYFKQLAGSGKLTLTTGVSGASNLVMNSGTYVAIIYVDENGNVTTQGATPTDVIASGNTQPATSSGVAQAISSAVGSPDVSNAVGVLPVLHGGTGQTTQGATNKAIIADLSEGSSDVTDGTMFVSSYASNNGFADTNDGGPNKPYKRKFLTVWNYIKGKIGNIIKAISANGYWGMADPNGADNVWIRTTLQGIIPYQGGGATAGHCSLGTSSWYFANAYIQNIYGSLNGGATSASRLGSISINNIRIGSSQARISLNQLMTWLITTKAYIPSGTDCYKVLGVPWDYAGNDILQLQIASVNYEIQLAGCIIEFLGNATNYNTGRFRLRIHTSPTSSYTPTSGYRAFPLSSIAEYVCNGSGFSPTWTAILSTSNMNTWVLDRIYPVGSIYMSTTHTSPQTFLGGTWEEFTDGRFLRASGGNAGTVGSVQAEGLPNITGSIKGTGYSIGVNTGATNSGALTGSEFNMKTASGTSQSASYMSKISFNASDGNSTVPDGASSGKIYGNSSHVTPKNMAVYMWRRTT